MICSKKLRPVDYHRVFTESKGNLNVKNSSHWLVVALLLTTTVSLPSTLKAVLDTPTGPISIPSPTPPPDGNPTGPPGVVMGQ